MAKFLAGSVFLEGSDCVWEVAIEADDVERTLQPAGIRDAITQRECDVYPDISQFEFAVDMLKWAKENDPDMPGIGSPQGMV